MNQVRLNQAIRAAKVRLIDANGQQVGIVSLEEALKSAADAGLDLAEIAPQANPPVVKVLDWGKYKYELTKQQQKSRKKQKNIDIKQVRISLKIGQHDLEVKKRQALKFLNEGDKVKLSLLLRGREITRQDLGRELLSKVAAELEEVGEIEQPIQLTGRELNLVLGGKLNAQTKDA